MITHLAFGWNAVTIDGHDYSAIKNAITKAFTQNKPTAIILNTIKGKGVSFLEQIDDHHLRIDSEIREKLIN